MAKKKESHSENVREDDAWEIEIETSENGLSEERKVALLIDEARISLAVSLLKGSCRRDTIFGALSSCASCSLSQEGEDSVCILNLLSRAEEKVREEIGRIDSEEVEKVVGL